LEAPPFWGVEKVKQPETQAVLDKDDSHNNQPTNQPTQQNKTANINQQQITHSCGLHIFWFNFMASDITAWLRNPRC